MRALRLAFDLRRCCPADSLHRSAQKELYPLVAAIGIGPLFQIPYLAMVSRDFFCDEASCADPCLPQNAAMPISEMATATSTIGLIRSLGGTVGISIGGSIYASELSKRLRAVDGYAIPDGHVSVGDVSGLTKIQVSNHFAI